MLAPAPAEFRGVGVEMRVDRFLREDVIGRTYRACLHRQRLSLPAVHLRKQTTLRNMYTPPAQIRRSVPEASQACY